MLLNASNISIIKRLMAGRGGRPLKSILMKMAASEIASLIPGLTIYETGILCDALSTTDKASAALLQLPEHQLKEVLLRIEKPTIKIIFNNSSLDDVAKLIGVFTDTEWDPYLDLLDEGRRKKVRLFLSYPEDSAGRMMQTNAFYLMSSCTAVQALNEIRQRSQNESIYYIYCVNELNQLEGVCSLRQIVICNPETVLSTIMRKDIATVEPDMPASQAADIVSKFALIAIPVVDKDRKMHGILTVDDIVDLIKDQATTEVYAQAGLQEDDRVYTPAFVSAGKRLPWMVVNLLLAAVASTVVSQFEDTMSLLIVLASLKNIVAGVAGNTAIQSLAVVMRGLSVGDFQFVKIRTALFKEITTGIIIGLVIGIAAAVLTYFWKGNLMVSIVILVSMILNSFVASLFGAATPLILQKFKLDPATGSGPIVTMVSDIFSFFSFLGIATLALHWV
jgi:magnesium transporter